MAETRRAPRAHPDRLPIARQLLLYWLVRGASALLRVIPVRLSYALAGALGEAYCFVRPSHSRWAAFNLARVLNEPEQSPCVQRIARKSFANYARVLVDFFRLPYLSHAAISASASVLGLEDLQRARDYGKGIILITAHMGSWDRAGAVLTGLGYDATVLVDTFSPPQLDRWVTRTRRKFGMQSIAVESPGALREMFRVLQRNETLVLLIDRPEPRGVPVTFFGERTYFPRGIPHLAVRTGCPVIVCGLFRRPDNVTYDGFTTLIPPMEGTTDDGVSVPALTQRIVDILETAIVAHPAQWYMFRPMWETVNGQRRGTSQKEQDKSGRYQAR